MSNRLLILNECQETALTEIMAAFKPGWHHLLTGYAGSGKTTLMQRITQEMQKLGRVVVLTAPTHKAVQVLASKAQAAGIEVGSTTIHSLLSLRPKAQGDRQVFVRSKQAQPVTADVVVIDECSMVDASLMRHIKLHLPNTFVLFVGDPAQLPPVNEKASETFETLSRSHLSTIVRQAVGNPVLDAAHAIRESQNGPIDWTWMRSAHAKPCGVYLPNDADAWMRKAFTSDDFARDPDTFRYLCWTNARVAQVNRRIREWRYGRNLQGPFVPGEMALVRQPVIEKQVTIFNTNEEAEVLDIQPDDFQHRFEATGGVEAWRASVPSWRVTLRASSGLPKVVHIPSDDTRHQGVVEKVKEEAYQCASRWDDLHTFRTAMARLQSIYALTVHTSQGSTFGSVFVDIQDIKGRVRSNLLEAQQLLYVAATRPTNALILVNT